MFATINNLTVKYKKYDLYDFIMCCFLALGLVFYQERTTYLDNAYLLFNMLDSSTFRVEHYRYTAIIPQILAVLGIKIGLGIKYIAILLSFGYLFFHFIIYWVIKHKLGQRALGIVYLACLLLAMHESFFDMVTESKLALGLGVLYAGIILTQSLSNSQKLIFSLLIFGLGVFSHPAFILYFGIVILFYWLFKKQVYWQHFVAIGLLYFIKSTFFGSSSYENTFYQSFGDWTVFSTSFLHQFMWGHIGKYYKLILIIVYLVSTHLYRKNLRKEMGVYLMSIVGIYFILAIANSAGESHMMIQKSLYILSFVCLYPMVYFYNEWANKLFLNFLIPLVLLSSFFSIDKASIKYSQRLDRLSSQISDLTYIGEKLYISETQIEPSSMLGSWALPFESAIVSKWFLNKSITLYKTKKGDQINTNQTDFLHVFDLPIPVGQMNPKYFNFSDTTLYQQIDSTFILN